MHGRVFENPPKMLDQLAKQMAHVMNQELRQIDINQIDPHPENPRLVKREDVIEQIAANINGSGFDPAHAVLIRPLDGRFQVISGHNRLEAAKRAGVSTIPAWVREMDDQAAYLELVRSNAQSELTPLERGLHALGATEKGKHGLSVNAYATALGQPEPSVRRE